ncbi:MAG: hypothetical protein Q9194_001196 [Teloschistes cf. exilis]
MGDGRSNRVGSALSALIQTLIPPLTNEDDASLDERREDALALATSIIDGHSRPSVLPDIGHVSDRIKQKILTNGDGDDDKAIRVSNLLSRLTEQPVLSQKSAILHLLHELAEADPLNDVPESNGHQPDNASLPRDGIELPKAVLSPHKPPTRALEDAFSVNGLRQLPTREARLSPSRETIASRDRRYQSRSETSVPPSEVHLEVATHTVMDTGPTEASLLHDLPFTLQGLSSTHLLFSSRTTLDLPPTLPLPVLSLLHKLAEPSLLYRVLSDFVDSHDEGLVAQSLRAAIGLELRSYLGLIATLEGEIRRAIAIVNPNESRGGVGKAGVTLKRCVVWTRDATMGLRLMSSMAEEAKSRKGGHLITMIHSFATSHGDPFVAAFAERMLAQITRPFYEMLRQWIYDGELSDPYHEFFVHEQSSKLEVSESGIARPAPATSVWEDKYKLEEAMIPSIIAEEFARKIFLIGKSLNFIRYGCGDSAWVEAYCKDASRELQYGDTATLETSIDKAYKTTMARLIDLMDNKFKLFEHLRALKSYILLGQGDFIALLMESLAPALERPAGTQYRHALTAQLEHAVRGSIAQYDSPDILSRLDARLLELAHGDIGWDVFTLEYRIDAPVDVVITSWASTQYLRVFNFLWRIKRVEFALGSTWRRCMTGARGVLASVDNRPGGDWKNARCCIAEMIHFVNQLQYYILFEVIEARWAELQRAITKPNATLDDLIQAHTKYLNDITHKGLLGKAKSGVREEGFSHQIYYLLKTMLAYKDSVDGLYSYSVAEFTRRQEQSARQETRLAATQQKKRRSALVDEGARADSPFPIAPPVALSTASSADSVLPPLRQRLEDLSKSFGSRVNVLLGDLLAQPDADMKFLATVMNFNDVYSPRKKPRGGKGKTPAASVKSRSEKESRDGSKEGSREAKGEDADKRSAAGDAVDGAKEKEREKMDA